MAAHSSNFFEVHLSLLMLWRMIAAVDKYFMLEIRADILRAYFFLIIFVCVYR